MESITTRFSLEAARSYATEANLAAALTRCGLADANPIICRNREGRWTAIFTLGGLGTVPAVTPAYHGFLTVN